MRDRNSIRHKKEKIISYLNKHPFSTLRNIADNYDVKAANYTIVSKWINDLRDDKKIDCLRDIRGSYYAKPSTLDDGRKVIRKVLTSCNIFGERFSNITYNKSTKDSGFSDMLKNLIALSRIKRQNHVHDLEKKAGKKMKKHVKYEHDKSFLIKFANYWSEIDSEPKITSLEELTELCEIAIDLEYDLAKKHRQFLQSHKKSLEHRLDLLREIAKQKNYRDAADIDRNKLGKRKTIKAVRRKLREIVDEKDNTRLNWTRADSFFEAETDNPFSYLDGKISSKMLKILRTWGVTQQEIENFRISRKYRDYHF